MELKTMVNKAKAATVKAINSDTGKLVAKTASTVAGEAAIIGYSALAGVPTLVAGVFNTVDKTYETIEGEYIKAKNRK